MNDSCPECGAPLVAVSHCREYLNEMIKWDFEDFKGVGQIHHLTGNRFGGGGVIP